MKTVKYVGSTAKNIGRFGFVKPDMELLVYEYEYKSIKNNKEFERVNTRKRHSAKSGTVLPVGTMFYDLRAMDWDCPQIHDRLIAEGKTTLVNMCKAMASIGCDIVITEHSDRDDIVDAIETEANYHKWEEITRAERHKLPVFMPVKNYDSNATMGVKDSGTDEDSEEENDSDESEETDESEDKSEQEEVEDKQEVDDPFSNDDSAEEEKDDSIFGNKKSKPARSR